jgi:hypothetical protein
VGESYDPPEIERGVVDYIDTFRTTGRVPGSVEPFSQEVIPETEQGGCVHIIAAGAVLRADYWQKQRQIHWHDMLNDPSAAGSAVMAFLEFKEQIRAELTPDFLLIDSRTGVTEVGGIATSVLADQVMCFLIDNRENLDGSRMVMRSFRQAWRPPGMERLVLDVALSRVPYDEEGDAHAARLEEVRTFLNEDAEVLEHTLAIDEILVLHSEPSLQTNERLLLASGRGTDSLPLHGDYERLFGRLIPSETVSRIADTLIAAARDHIWQDAARTQRELEAIAPIAPTKAYRELLVFHRLRQSGPGIVIQVARSLWDTTRDSHDPLVWEAVHGFLMARPGVQHQEAPDVPLRFLEAVWAAGGEREPAAGLSLSRAYVRRQDYASAAGVLEHIIGDGNAGEEVLQTYVTAASEAGLVGDVVHLAASLLSGPVPLGLLDALADFVLKHNQTHILPGVGKQYARLREEGVSAGASLSLAVRVLSDLGDFVSLAELMERSLGKLEDEPFFGVDLSDIAQLCVEHGVGHLFRRALVGHADEERIVSGVPALDDLPF